MNQGKRYFFGVLSIFLVLFFVQCKSTADTTQAVMSKDQKTTIENQALVNALLWKIEGNGLEKPSFLYGTIHIIDKDDFFYPENTLESVNQSEQMAFEIDMDDMNNIGKQMGMLTKAIMKDGQTLSDLLSEEDYKLVKDHFDGMGLPMMFVEKIKPMFLTVFASDDIDPMAMQSGEMLSYEMQLYEKGKERDLKSHGLETIEYQIGLFDSIPYADQAQMLVETIKGSGEEGEEDMFKMMVDMYKNQDINGMYEMMLEEEEGTAEFEDILVTQRNRNWIPIMAEMMDKKATFFAVGAGHLGGPNGVIKLLQKEGYSLTPLSHISKI